MNANTSWKPRVVLQDALVVDIQGKARHLRDKNLNTIDNLLVVNRHELDEEGIRAVARFVRDERIGSLSYGWAAQLADSSPERFAEALGLQAGPQAEKLFHDFQQLAPPQRGLAVFNRLTEHLDRIIEAPNELVESLKAQERAMRDTPVQRLMGTLDAFERTAGKFRQKISEMIDNPLGALSSLLSTRARASEETPVFSSPPHLPLPEEERSNRGILTAINDAGNRAFYRTSKLLFTSEGEPSRLKLGIAATAATGTALGFAGMGLSVEAAAVVYVTTATASVSVNLPGFARSLLDKAPQIHNGEEIARQAAQTIERAVSPRQRELFELSYLKPIFVIGDDPAYLHSSSAGRLLAGFAGWDHTIWLKRTPDGSTVREECEHTVNHLVGYSHRTWESAAENELARADGRAFINRISSKEDWPVRYAQGTHGAELLQELNQYVDAMRSRAGVEAAMAEIDRHLPEAAPLLRLYRESEKEFVDFHKEKRGHTAPAKTPPAEERTNTPESEQAPDRPSRLPKDHKARDASTLKERGRGNTTDLGQAL